MRAKTKKAKGSKGKAAKKSKGGVPGVCRECGCTEDAACETDDGPCSWANTEMTLCSNCVTDETTRFTAADRNRILSELVAEMDGRASESEHCRRFDREPHRMAAAQARGEKP